MKKVLTMLFACAAMSACTQGAPEGGLAGLENLDETGLQFVEMLQKRPTWQAEWAEMAEHGQPLPNEMIVLSSMGTNMTFCFVPVVDGKKVVRLVVSQIITGNENDTRRAQNDSTLVSEDSVPTTRTATHKPTLGTPLILDEKGIDKNSVARSFIGLDIVKAWRDKGYELNVDLSPAQLNEQQSATRGSTAFVYQFDVYITMNTNLDWDSRWRIGDQVDALIENYNYNHTGVSFSTPHKNYEVSYLGGYVVEVTPNDMSSSTAQSAMEYGFCPRLAVALLTRVRLDFPVDVSGMKVTPFFLWERSNAGSGGGSGSGSGSGGGSGNTAKANEIKAKLISVLRYSKIKTLIQNKQISFREDNYHATAATFHAQFANFGAGNIPLSAEIIYSPNHIEQLTERGQMLVFYHEYTHAALDADGITGPHDKFPGSPDYQQGLRDIFPGYNDEFYDAIMYMGCEDLRREQLSPSEKARIEEIINKALFKQY